MRRTAPRNHRRTVAHADAARCRAPISTAIGLAGNDTLYADDTNGLDGNTLLGGPGNDQLLGGVGLDTLYGGPGNDNLSGGGSADLLVGGSGHDHIDGGRGNDTIQARDGQRDWISCGPGRRDNVFADRVDVIATDCELVHKR
jgi:Ca2+-binding RTX toxin-like protein